MLVNNIIGNTPIIKLDRLGTPQHGQIFVKLEECNIGGSIKARVALQMIIDAEKRGVLVPFSGQTVLEPTGGNTGIGLTIFGKRRGYNVKLVIPDNFSHTRIELCKKYGAEVILSDSTIGKYSHVITAKEILQNNKDYVYLDQFSNLANPGVHYFFTAHEILNLFDNIDYFVASVGSGGTLSGIGRRLKKHHPHIQIVAVQPEGCDILRGIACTHVVEATALGFVPDNFDTSVVDSVEIVTNNSVIEMFHRLPKEEGLFLGLSSAANICAAINIAQRISPEKIVVTVSPDSGQSYAT